MTTALIRFDLIERRRLAVDGPFAPLALALRNELSPLIGGALPLPEHKARLTRIGGRCTLDGTLLRFKPFSPHEHECPQCRRVYMGQAHDDWWAMGAQLWLAERAAQAAALHALAGDREAGGLALRILTELAARYHTWLNRDNALGPTRPFFSTYLESIWLLNVCHAVALLELAPRAERESHALSQVREMLVAPSRNLIATFDEGLSNRQVWNEVAILSASQLLGDNATIEARLAHGQGLHALLAQGLLADGTWYEGENYHLFAHRGLWYGLELLHALDRPVEPALLARFRAGFVQPFAGLLPDDTLPSRRDSQYRVSVRQWRFAEWCELGLAHSPGDPRLSGLLHRLYDDTSLPDGEWHRFSTADAERNEPAGALSRSGLSWRALLKANSVLSPRADFSLESVCLPDQGLAVLRRNNGRTYIALEGGHTGGGHGHPDRLALTLQQGNARLLEDPGTGSYVERALHWYRSTLAHFAPLVDGASQPPSPCELLAFEERGGAGWISKRLTNAATGITITRSVVVADHYLVDLVSWTAPSAHRIELPLARRADLHGAHEWLPAKPDGAGNLEDGFDFLTEVVTASFPTAHVEFHIGGTPEAVARYASSGAASLWRAEAPGSPGHDRTPLHWMRVQGESGIIAGVWSWGASVTSVRLMPGSEPPLIQVATVEGTVARHSPTDAGWHIALEARHATSSIDLEKFASPKVATEDGVRPPGAIPTPLHIPLVATTVDDVRVVNALASGSHAKPGHVISGALRFSLGERHYVRTEQSWQEAGQPVAVVQVASTREAIVVDVLSRTGPIIVPLEHDENLLDNERRDVNADGVQVHIGQLERERWEAGWLLVPAAELFPLARVSELEPGTHSVHATWTPTADGWAMRLSIPICEVPFVRDHAFIMEVVVNERPAERQRRRGQLVLSGGGGFGYLRGDRRDPALALHFRLGAIDDAGLTASPYL